MSSVTMRLGRRCTGFCVFILTIGLSYEARGYIEDQYIGCYYDTVNQRSYPIAPLPNNAALTIELCIEKCRSMSTTYARLQNATACSCGDEFGINLPDYACRLPCPGDRSEYCGGFDGKTVSYSLFSVCPIGYYGAECNETCHCKRQAPCDRASGICPNGCERRWEGPTCNSYDLTQSYIGCYKDNEPRAFPGEFFRDLGMTVELCTSTCSARNSSVAGVQSYTHCVCGDGYAYATYGQLTDDKCNTSCQGNSNQSCGGDYINSVYYTCPNGTWGRQCRNVCNCNNDTRCEYNDGRCPLGCKPGWTGRGCNVRNCATFNGDCLESEKCTTVDLRFASVNHCQCSPGFQKKAFWNTCTDCDINTYGNYHCTPKDGTTASASTNSYVNTVVGAAVGSSLASIAVTVIIFLTVLFCRRKKKQEQKSLSKETQNHTQIIAASPNRNTLMLTTSNKDYEGLNTTSEKTEESAYTELNVA